MRRSLGRFDPGPGIGGAVFEDEEADVWRRHVIMPRQFQHLVIVRCIRRGQPVDQRMAPHCSRAVVVRGHQSARHIGLVGAIIVEIDAGGRRPRADDAVEIVAHRRDDIVERGAVIVSYVPKLRRPDQQLHQRLVVAQITEVDIDAIISRRQLPEDVASRGLGGRHRHHSARPAIGGKTADIGAAVGHNQANICPAGQDLFQAVETRGTAIGDPAKGFEHGRRCRRVDMDDARRAIGEDDQIERPRRCLRDIVGDQLRFALGILVAARPRGVPI